MKENPTLRYAMIGGGIDSAIGSAHRAAIAITTYATLVAGSFSRDREKNKKCGKLLQIPEENIFASYEELAASAKTLDIDFVVVATRPASHFEICAKFLQEGIAVVCDKPLTVNLKEALLLQEIVKEKSLDFMVTYTYSGYPLIIEARERILQGELGELRLANVSYQQDWMPRRFEPAENKHAFWRTRTDEAGPSCCIGDIGIHAEHMVRFLTQKPINSLIANIQSYTDGNSLDDNAFIFAQHSDNFIANYWCSQICVGRHNKFDVQIVGSKGSLEWSHTSPEILKLFQLGKPEQILKKGDPNLSRASQRRCFMALEHCEGMHHAFASLYSAFCRTLINKKNNYPPDEHDFYPTIEDGLLGIRFIEACIKSNEENQHWTNI